MFRESHVTALCKIHKDQFLALRIIKLANKPFQYTILSLQLFWNQWLKQPLSYQKLDVIGGLEIRFYLVYNYGSMFHLRLILKANLDVLSVLQIFCESAGAVQSW